MARQKRLSDSIEKAAQRLNALRSIDPALDLGGSLTLASFETKIDEARNALNAYNGLLTQVDAAYNQLTAAEQGVAEYSQRMLSGVAASYGKDSDEYEQAGGTRTSERRKFTRKTAPA
jgi:DNA repair exonuclease SbcCD ATPase subunit